MLSRVVAIGMVAMTVSTPALGRGRLSDAQVKQRIIKASIADYPGNCACPFNSASNGSRCGGRSAWSRGGGYAPMCYANDVTKADVRAWRVSN